MTYAELFNKAVKALNLDESKINDWRPADAGYLYGIQVHIPNAIIIWLNTGERIIFIDKMEEKE